MNISEVFNLNRIKQYTYFHWNANKKSYITQILGLFVVSTGINILLIQLCYKFNSDTYVLDPIYIWTFILTFVLCTFITTKSFTYRTTKGHNINHLLIPISVQEKFWFETIIRMVIYPLAILLITIISLSICTYIINITNVISETDFSFFPDQFLTKSNIRKDIFKTILGAYSTVSLFFMCSTIFNKNRYLLTILSTTGFGIIVSLISLGIIYSYDTNIFTLSRTINLFGGNILFGTLETDWINISLILLSIFICISIAYYRVKEQEV